MNLSNTNRIFSSRGGYHSAHSYSCLNQQKSKHSLNRNISSSKTLSLRNTLNSSVSSYHKTTDSKKRFSKISKFIPKDLRTTTFIAAIGICLLVLNLKMQSPQGCKRASLPSSLQKYSLLHFLPLISNIHTSVSLLQASSNFPVNSMEQLALNNKSKNSSNSAWFAPFEMNTLKTINNLSILISLKIDGNDLIQKFSVKREFIDFHHLLNQSVEFSVYLRKYLHKTSESLSESIPDYLGAPKFVGDFAISMGIKNVKSLALKPFYGFLATICGWAAFDIRRILRQMNISLNFLHQFLPANMQARIYRLWLNVILDPPVSSASRRTRPEGVRSACDLRS